ncbi:MAG: TetR/AcrR family transcriptional regulator [Thermodesulfobacteriota bacterium]
MARTREFEIKSVIHNATILFCQKGYDGTSINDLVSATKLNRHSMYEIFKNKEGLYIECLYYFSYEYLSNITDILNKKPKDIDSIKNYLTALIDHFTSPNYHGCLYCATISSKDSLPPEIIDVVDRYFAQLESMIITCLSNAKKSAQIPKNKSCEDLTAFILTSVIGLAIGSRAKMPKKTLLKVYDNIVYTLVN